MAVPTTILTIGLPIMGLWSYAWYYFIHYFPGRVLTPSQRGHLMPNDWTVWIRIFGVIWESCTLGAVSFIPVIEWEQLGQTSGMSSLVDGMTTFFRAFLFNFGGETFRYMFWVFVGLLLLVFFFVMFAENIKGRRNGLDGAGWVTCGLVDSRFALIELFTDFAVMSFQTTLFSTFACTWHDSASQTFDHIPSFQCWQEPEHVIMTIIAPGIIFFFHLYGFWARLRVQALQTTFFVDSRYLLMSAQMKVILAAVIGNMGSGENVPEVTLLCSLAVACILLSLNYRMEPYNFWKINTLRSIGFSCAIWMNFNAVLVQYMKDVESVAAVPVITLFSGLTIILMVGAIKYNVRYRSNVVDFYESSEGMTYEPVHAIDKAYRHKKSVNPLHIANCFYCACRRVREYSLETNIVVETLKLSNQTDCAIDRMTWSCLFDCGKGITHLDCDGEGMGDAGAITLFQVLPISQSAHTVETINLRGNGISVGGAKAIAPALHYLTNLKHLRLNESQLDISLLKQKNVAKMDLSHQKLDDTDLTIVSHFLNPKEVALVSFSVAGNKIGDQGVNSLLDGYLTQQKSVQWLDFSGNPSISATASARLADVALSGSELATFNSIPIHQLQSEQVEVVDLSSKLFGLAGAYVLSRVLRSNESLKELQLSGTELGMEGCKALVPLIKDHCPNLDIINFASNGIGPEGMKVLAPILGKDNKKIKQLDLSWNSMAPEGAAALAESLAEDNCLVHLDISFNLLSSEGTQAIGGALKKNKTLAVLAMQSNNVGSAGAEFIADMIGDNKTLVDLDVSNNQLGDDGAKAIMQTLEASNRSVSTINMASNFLSDVSGEALADVLRANASLESVDVSANDLGDVSATALGTALSSNDTLKWFNLSSHPKSRNKIGDSGALALANAITLNMAMEFLGLQHHRISPASKGAIDDAILTANREINVNLYLQEDDLVRQKPSLMTPASQDVYSRLEPYL